MAASPPQPPPKAPPKAPPAKFAAPAQPKAPAVAPAAPAAPVPPPFVPPARPKMAALLTDSQPAQHFVPRDPPQATTGVRQNPPANRQASVPADGTLGLGPGLDWQPFSTNH